MKNDLSYSRIFRAMAEFIAFWSRRQFSVLAALVGLVIILVPLYQIANGTAYFAPLNNIDQTTLIMIGVLILRTVTALRSDSDLQAVSLALVASLSFVYTFEAIYKWAFYLTPARMPPAEMREFVIQVGIALTGLVGFAFGRFHWTRLTLGFAGLFVLGWMFWILTGYPQIFDDRLYQPVMINITLSHDTIYLLNRLVKFSLFLAIFCAVRRPAVKETDNLALKSA